MQSLHGDPVCLWMYLAIWQLDFAQDKGLGNCRETWRLLAEPVSLWCLFSLSLAPVLFGSVAISLWSALSSTVKVCLAVKNVITGSRADTSTNNNRTRDNHNTHTVWHTAAEIGTTTKHWVGMFFTSVRRHCWLGNRKGIRPVKSWVLVCWWWHLDWSFACLIAPVVTTPSPLATINREWRGTS